MTVGYWTAPWVVRGGVECWLDVDVAARAGGHLSGGERRVLAVAASLAGGDPVDLLDVLTGLDPATLRIVLNALAHASGVPS